MGPSFSLIIPARHEEAVLGATLDQVAGLRYRRFEVIAVVGHDDPGTDRRRPRRRPSATRGSRWSIDAKTPKNKPKALNTALAACTGDIVGVFDAEDEVAPDLLTHVAAVFRQEHADVVQGGVQLMNFQSSWWSMRNVLEYFFYFRSRLHAHARWGFIPLGGNTVFVKRRRLVEAGGWDEDCLAEDCDLGVRLSTAGARVSVAYEARLATREETPATIADLVKQRTRWNQGFLQVLRKGDWRRLPTRRQRLLAQFTLAFPFLQAAMFVADPAVAADGARGRRAGGPRPVLVPAAHHRVRQHRRRGGRPRRVHPAVRPQGPPVALRGARRRHAPLPAPPVVLRRSRRRADLPAAERVGEDDPRRCPPRTAAEAAA